MQSYTRKLRQLDKGQAPIAGGKGANLGELFKIGGVHVPDGFCITVEAYEKVIREHPPVSDLIRQLSAMHPGDRESIRVLSEEIRERIGDIGVPGNICREIQEQLSRFPTGQAFAIRSSATAEDLPSASFAGQQESYLNVIGEESILKHIVKCWASLFTERASIYRIQNGFDPLAVGLAVVVQKMVSPAASGVLFTADPVTGNRKTLIIDAVFGLGDALVSGLVNGDIYRVKTGEVVELKSSANRVLDNTRVLQLEQLGRKIESHFGGPQDIEWCLAGEEFYIIQTRPITTLFPIPIAGDSENHVYISVGHQQMMTDALKPLGISMWQLTASRPMATAGGRLFVDVARQLTTPTGRTALLAVMEQHDPLIKEALQNLLNRGDFIHALPDEINGPPPIRGSKGKTAGEILGPMKDAPAIVKELIAENEQSITTLKQNIRGKTGTGLFDFMEEDTRVSKERLRNSRMLSVIIAAVDATVWLNDNVLEWLGEKNTADILTRSVSGNITSEMGLALLEVSDAIRPFPEVVDYLKQVTDDDFIQKLNSLPGGIPSGEAILRFLDKYGMRCPGEIDITRSRWKEKPTALLPVILSNIKNFEPGMGWRQFEEGKLKSYSKEQELLGRLEKLPDGQQKSEQTRQMIGLLRTVAGYREYPKYGIVNRSFIYRQALLKEAEELVRSGTIRDLEEVYYLSFEEFREAVSIRKADPGLIDRRKEEFKNYEKLTPPRVMTSDGEIITGKYHRENIPVDAILGLAVSSGIVEGRARVLLNIDEAQLEEGDILVTVFTDPSWTPLFVSAKGLVTEVGGMMTHGAVIAREYGLPAVVGVENATRLIKDGQRIRVNGTDGYVQVLK